MKNVCVITGGGSGMGLATARILGKENYIIIAGRTVNKLDNAIAELEQDGIEAEAFACNIVNFDSVKKLAARAKEIGTITSVIHAAGMSPHMGDARTIMEANAIGTIHVNEAFYEVMEEGSCLIDVASMAAYLFPKIAELIIPKSSYKFSRTDKELLLKKMLARVNLLPKEQRSGLAYTISKHFVVWYAKSDAAKFGQKGIRILSVSPGSFETPMGEAEKDVAGPLTLHGAIKRMGKVDEIANLFACLVDEKLGYLTGTDILCDGGLVASGYIPKG